MEEEKRNQNTPETRGWEIVRSLNEGIGTLVSTEARKLLADYFALNTHRPSKLHSAILSTAVKMAMTYPDFHFVPFLNLWGLENLRTEDSESQSDASGKRFPSLVEKMSKAYAYSLLFHPEEHLAAELENIISPYIERKGYNLAQPVTPLLATRVFTSEVRGRKMTFVQLISADGTDYSTEVHTLTTYQRLRYDDIPERLFNVLLRKSENGTLRVEAAVLSDKPLNEIFPTSVGYVEHIDLQHKHIHVFDNQSRHFVATLTQANSFVKEGDYAQITTIIPKGSRFKSAIINKVYAREEGPEAFGYRKVKITYVDTTKGYCAWDLLPGEAPIVETGTESPSFMKGYINQQLFNKMGIAIPLVGTEIGIIVFLRRGKDDQKHPYVVGIGLL